VSRHAHLDAREGFQYHLRYEPAADPGRVYWSYVSDDKDEASRTLKLYQENPDRYRNVRMFVREVSPWRELS
jgi:hypothetical protein